MSAFRRLVKNALQCLECKKVVVSLTRHDFVSCGCPNEAFVDGGLDYARHGAINLEKTQDLCEWSPNHRQPNYLNRQTKSVNCFERRKKSLGG
jgi:hypothetical protein